MNRTLVVVPTFNERETIGGLTLRLLELVPPVDVLIVDDNSPDGTGRLADELAARHPAVQVLHRPGKAGLGRAYLAGFQWALERGYEHLFEMDGDGSHDPDAIPTMLRAAEQADVVLGSRYSDHGVRVVNWPLRRLLLSRGAGVYVRLITGMPFSDPTGGYRCFRRRALETIGLGEIQSDGYAFQIETLHRAWRRGLVVTEVPIVFTERVRGQSKMSRAIVWEALWFVWRLWFQNGLRRRRQPVG